MTAKNVKPPYSYGELFFRLREEFLQNPTFDKGNEILEKYGDRLNPREYMFFWSILHSIAMYGPPKD